MDEKYKERNCAVHAVQIENMKEDINEIKQDVKELHDLICKNGFYAKFLQTNIRTKINTWLIGILLASMVGVIFKILIAKI